MIFIPVTFFKHFDRNYKGIISIKYGYKHKYSYNLQSKLTKKLWWFTIYAIYFYDFLFEQKIPEDKTINN